MQGNTNSYVDGSQTLYDNTNDGDPDNIGGGDNFSGNIGDQDIPNSPTNNISDGRGNTSSNNCGS